VYKGYANKSNLGSDREHRKSQKRINAKAAFGIYRPLTDDSRRQIGETIGKIDKEVKHYLGERPSQAADFGVHSNFGTTYLLREYTHRALKNRQIDSFAGPRLQNELAGNSQLRNEIEIPLVGFGWFGTNDRKFGAVIDVRPADLEQMAFADKQLEELVEDTRALDDALIEVGAIALTHSTRIPEHVSFINYKTKSHKSVAATQRNVISDITHEHFSKDNITSLQLGEFVVGSYYSEPLQLAA
jgi:hypothetical protein